MDLSFIIPAYNEAENIENVITSIKLYVPDVYQYEVLVVDHGSKDNTVKLAEANGAKILSHPEGTIAGLRNLGVKNSTGCILVFLDADILLTQDWKVNIGKVITSLLAGERIITGSWYSVPDNPNWIEKFWFKPLERGDNSHINSGHLIISRQLFDEVGGFDEQLETGEDYDISVRAKAANIRLIDYDSVFSYVRDDIPFYVDAARDADGPILELGCGTGRVALPIAEAGIDIVGLDSSAAMLDVARSKARRLASGSRRSRASRGGSLTLVEADMRDFSMDTRFALVIIPFRGFLSLLTVEDQTNALQNIKRHLAPGGKLVFNIFVPDLDRLTQDGDVPYHYRDVTDPDTGARLVLWNQSSYDNHNQVIDTRMIVEELDGEGAVARRLYRDFRLRYVHRWEMHHLLELCGFEVLDLYGDFDRSPFDETSAEMVWVAGRPNG